MKNRIEIHSKKGIENRWNLSNPAHCRDFLKALRMGENGSAITQLKQADGTWVSIDDAADEAIVDLVRELAQAMEKSQ